MLLGVTGSVTAELRWVLKDVSMVFVKLLVCLFFFVCFFMMAPKLQTLNEAVVE